MKALSQSLIDTLMADSNYTTTFPEFALARQNMSRIINNGNVKSGGCCGNRADATSSADAIKGVLSSLKKSIATMAKERQNQLLTMLGYKALQVSYNDPATGALKTVVLEL